MARAAGCRLGPDQQRRVPDFQAGHRKGPPPANSGNAAVGGHAGARDLLGSLSGRTRPEATGKPPHRKSGSTDPGKFDAKTGKHLGPADAALPFDAVGDCPVAINAPGAVEVDAMFDSAKIMVDNYERAAQRRKFAARGRLGTFNSPALAGIAHCAQFAAHRISMAVWLGGNLARSVYITLGGKNGYLKYFLP